MGEQRNSFEDWKLLNSYFLQEVLVKQVIFFHNQK